jgi:hypothetical protein
MNTTILRKISFLGLAMCLSLFAIAQEDTKKLDVDIDVNKGGGDSWMSSPFVWVVGGAVFILLLVALLRGGGRNKTA